MTGPPVPKIQPRPPRLTNLPRNPVPSASPNPRSSEVTKPQIETPPANPTTEKTSPPGPEGPATSQEKSEKTQSRSEDKNDDATGSGDGVKAALSTKKKFPIEED